MTKDVIQMGLVPNLVNNTKDEILSTWQNGSFKKRAYKSATFNILTLTELQNREMHLVIF